MMPIGWAITVVVLCVAVVVLAIIVLGVLRQVIPVLERAVPAPTLALHSHGPTVGSPLPHFAAVGTDGEITTEQLQGHPAVLLFLTTGCDPCKSLTAEMSRADLDDQLASHLIIITGPDGPRELEIPARLHVVTELDKEVSGPLSVTGTPFAIGVDSDGIVKAAVVPNTMSQLTELAAGLA